MFVLLPFVACATPTPSEVPDERVYPTRSLAQAEAISRVDVRGTTDSMAAIALEVRSISPEARTEAAESLRTLSVNCPYTRAALQIPLALHQAVHGIDPERIDPFVRDDWKMLQRGLSIHLEVFDALEVDLPMPQTGDHLHQSEPGVMIDRKTLAATRDPILATSALVLQVTALAEGVDDPTHSLIEDESERVEKATGIGRTCPRGPWSVLPGHPWTLGLQIGGWHDALKRIQPFVEEPDAQREIRDMIALLDAYGEQSAE